MLKGMRKKRETGYRGYLYRLILPPLLSFFPCCATHSSHKEVDIKIHIWIFYTFVVKIADLHDVITPHSTCKMIVKSFKASNVISVGLSTL